MVNSEPPAPVSEPSSQVVARVRAQALEVLGLPIVITDDRLPDPTILWVNLAFTAATDYAAQEVVGRGLRLLHDPDGTDPEAGGALLSAMAESVHAQAVLVHYRRDGSSFWGRVTASPVPDEDGGATHWVALVADVTDEVRREAAQRVSIETERRARAGLSLISQVSDLLADLDTPYILREITALLSQEAVDWAEFYLNDGGLQHVHGVDVANPPSGRGRRHGAGPTSAELHAGRGAPAPPETPDIVQELLDRRIEGPVEIDLADDYPQGSASAWLRDQLLDRVPRGEGLSAVVVYALPGRRRVLGLLVTAPPGGGGLSRMDQSSRTLLQIVARRVGMSIDNVRLYAREHRLAETLQRSMLPEQADIDGLDVWTYYSPNSEHAQVGGDWYDVLQIGQDVAGIVIGDVAGHDIEAAAAMGQLRSVVRSYAYELTDPGPVAENVDQLVAGMRVPRSASVVYAALSRREAGWTCEYTRAGHLPPLLVRAGQVTQLAAGAGPLIGFGEGARATGTAELHPGDVLVFYTDGLVERRSRSLRAGLQALIETAQQITAIDAAGIGEELLAYLADAPEDDIAVVVVRIPDPVRDAAGRAASIRSRRWVLPSEPSSIGWARHAVVRTCQAWGLPDEANAELVVSELVANGVLHGWGHIALRLFDTGEGLRIEVEDSNPAPPVTTDGHPNRVGGYGMQIVERLADWGWRPAGTGKLVWARIKPTSRPA